MADDKILRTIYKLEIDDSAYIKGVDNLSASTNKFTQVQEAANKALKLLENALAEQSKSLQKAKEDLDSYRGADEKYKQQLAKTYSEQKVNNDKLIALVAQSRQEYEKATKAAQDFANTSSKANNLQQQPGSRIAPLTPPPSVAAGLNAQIFNTVNLTEFGELASITAKTKTEFDELRDSITLAEERLKQLDSSSDEFKALVPIIDEAKKALNEYDKAAEGATDATVSLKTQIREGRDELVRLEEQGKANTKEYFELEKRVAKLTDAFGDQQQRIKILASDTKLLDFGKGAITAATAAFQTYTSISILAGGANEELQKKTLQLFAAMQLLQSLEQLSNLTRREGVLATLAQSGAQAAYTAVVGASTGALRAFRIALAATGIGAIIAGIAFLVIKMNELKEATKEEVERQKQFKEVNDEAIKSFTAEVTHLNLIKAKLNDLNTPQKERIKLAKEYNKTAEEGNKIDLKQIDNIALVNAAIDTQIAKIIERAKAKAAENLITQRQEQVFLQEEAARIRALQKVVTVADKNLQSGAGEDRPRESQLQIDQATGKIVARARTQAEIVADKVSTLIENDPELAEARKKLNDALKNLSPFINITDLIKPDTGTTTKVENEFAKRLKELQARLAEVTAKSFESEGTIRKQFAASLEKEISEIKSVDKRKLTDDQKTILIDLVAKINDVQLQEALNQFSKKVLDARNKLNEELRSLQEKNTEDTINLLQDEFDRRKQLIDFNEKQLLQDAEANTNERLAALEEQRNLIGEQQYQDAKNKIVQAGEDAQTNIILKASQDRQQLAADSFKKQLEFFQNAIAEVDLSDDRESAKRIRELSNKFLSQKITYEQFQKGLEKIEKDYAAKKRNRDLLILKDELDSLDFKIKTTEEKTTAHYAELLRLRDKLAADIAAKEKEDAVKDAQDKNTDDNKGKVETLNDYVNSVGQLADATIQFWQKANEAEAAALDRSISLQERRVDAAQRIAERGNAQYLKAEEDRLKELQVARENAARKQLGIDAALQASQILVGITGAIAKIATPGIGIAETIGAIGVIVGALATGYGLVKSLQGNQPTFFVGTKDTGKGGKVDNKGGFHAVLHPNEAVIPADKNRRYKPTIEAIYDGKIHPEVINNFVQNYHSVKRVPQVNYERIKEAAELKLSHDGKMAVILNEHSLLLKENNDLQRAILAKKGVKVENHINENGVATMVTEFMEKQRISKHT